MSQWTEDDVRRINAKRGVREQPSAAKPAKPSKYRNVKCVRDGLIFDSGAEADYWFDVLKVRERAGEITDLDRQVPYSLYCPVFINGETAFEEAKEVAVYRADYRWREVKTGEVIVADKKATDRKTGKKITTAEYRLKRLWLRLQSGIEIQEV